MTNITHNSVLAEAIFPQTGQAMRVKQIILIIVRRFGRGGEDQNPNVPSSDDHGHLRRA